jgi:enamine deaminase RidA (YjgF/YER057c/UK114 family)
VERTSLSPVDMKVPMLDVRKSGKNIYLTGISALNAEDAVSPGVYLQTLAIFNIVKKALLEHGANLKHVIACSVYLADTSHVNEFGLAFNDIFDNQKIDTSIYPLEIKETDIVVKVDIHARIDEGDTKKIARKKTSSHISPERHFTDKDRQIGNPDPHNQKKLDELSRYLGDLKKKNSPSSPKISSKFSKKTEVNLHCQKDYLEQLIRAQRTLDEQLKDWQRKKQKLDVFNP